MMKKNVVMMMAMLVGATASSAQAGLVAHWTFDEAPGGTAAADSSGNVNNATLRNGSTGVAADWDQSTTGFGATFAAGGKIGNFLSVNNTNDRALDEDSNDYATADTYQGVLGTGARSVAAWIFLDSSIMTADADATDAGMAKDQTIVTWGATGTGKVWRIRADSGTNPGDPFELRTEINGNGQQAGVIPVDKWVHIAVAWESTTGVDNDLMLFINGVNVGNFDFTKTVDTVASSTVMIGTTLEGASSGDEASRRSFAGGLDDVRIYDHKLSQAEVTALVPEPSSLVLGLGSLLGTLMMRRRKIVC